jgi:hypothetical protein
MKIEIEQEALAAVVTQVCETLIAMQKAQLEVVHSELKLQGEAMHEMLSAGRQLLPLMIAAITQEQKQSAERHALQLKAEAASLAAQLDEDEEEKVASVPFKRR